MKRKIDADAKVNIWIGNQPNPDDRLRLSLSKADRERANRIPRDSTETVTVYDIRTGKYYEITRADCGLGCRCAMGLVSVSDTAPARKRAAAKQTKAAIELAVVISRMKTSEEFGADRPEEYDWEETVNNLIAMARKVTEGKETELVITLSENEKDATVDLFNEAWGDQRHYLDNGNSTADYGDEWPLVAETKAETFEIGAAVLVKIGATGLAESFRKLAADFRESK